MPESIKPLLEPRSVAVIGASRKRGTVGGETFFNLITTGFNGPVYPVNPTAKVVQSVRAYPTILEVPDPVDLAVIVVPSQHALTALEGCAAKGVKAAIIISAGFKEVGGEGIEREDALVKIAKDHGIRLLGPNCLGVMNSDPSILLNATFAGTFPASSGSVSFLSQSGALGAVVLDLAARRNIGLASFVSVGNKCDISANDMLEYWERDARTQVILMYLESFGNPRKFVQLARRVGRTKPIIAVKSGRTRAGSRAAASHTGALAGADIAVDALFHQAGVIRVGTTEELFDTAMLLATQPAPKGRRVAVLTNAGGPGILATDACESHGLELATLSAHTVETLASFLPREASLYNPVDMIASATADHYGQAVEAILRDPAVDALLVIFVPPLMIDEHDVARAIGEAASGADKPLLTCFMGTHGFYEGLNASAGEASIPSYRFPEAAAKALSRATAYGEWLLVAESPVPGVCVDCSLAGNTVDACRDALATERAPLWLGPSDVPRLLAAYGIQTPESAVATSPEQAARLAEEMGFPVALKVVSDQVTHKTDVGGVILDRRDHKEVRQGFEQIVAKAWQVDLADSVQGVLVQRYVKQGIEAVVGVTQDPMFGHLIMFGLGGEYVELVQDVVFRLHPLTTYDIESMIRSVKASQLLKGYRGRRPGDEASLRDLLSKVNQMVTDIPELLEMDLNPVKILPPGDGCVVVDARIRLGIPRRLDRRLRAECVDPG